MTTFDNMSSGMTLMKFNPNTNCTISMGSNSQLSDRNSIRKVQECGVILLNRDLHELLVVLQRESMKWGFPKGHMSRMEMYNKDYFNCAKRELFEETGIDLRTHRHTKYGTIIISNKLFYIIEIKKKNISVKPIDIDEICTHRWIKRSELLDFVNMNSCNITMNSLFKIC